MNRTRPLLGFLLLLTLAAPLAAAQDQLDLIQGDGTGTGSQQPAPGGPGADPIEDPDKILRDAQDTLNGPSGGTAPAPPGGQKGIDQIGGQVVQVLAENWLMTTGVTLGLGAVGAAGWLLASRYVDPKVALQSPERSMLYGFVKGNPGVHLKQLSSEFDMKTSTVLWHVRKLEAAELIRSKKANGYRVFYPVSGGMEASRVSEAVTALSNGNARDIFGFLASTPGAHPRILTEALGINPGTVRWHLKKLVKAGLLDESGERRGVEYRPTELGVKAMRQLQGMLPQTIDVPAGVGPVAQPDTEIQVYN